MLIDTHCHLHDPEAFPDPAAEIAAAGRAGVERIVVVGTHPPDWPLAIALAEAHAPVFAIVGWHPNYTAEYSAESLAELRSLLAHPKVLALGEIGLDYHWDFAPRDRQFEALQAQLDLAEELGLPVVFHAREAYGDLLTVLEARPVRPYLFHCWGGNREEAHRGIALGALFGVDGPVTYKKSDELRATLAKIPIDRLVLETDSPYLSPLPHRGKTNRPAYIPLINAALAQLHGVAPEAMAATTTANAAQFFGPRLLSGTAAVDAGSATFESPA